MRAEIDLFGNADRFDYQRSVVEYYDAGRREQADLLARAIGVPEATLKAQVQESVDMTIILPI